MSIFKEGSYHPLGDGDGMSQGEYEYQYALCNEQPDPDDVAPIGARSLKTPPGKWRVRGGAILEIRKMTKEHLRNAINLFTRAGWGDHEKLEELREELARR